MKLYFIRKIMWRYCIDFIFTKGSYADCELRNNCNHVILHFEFFQGTMASWLDRQTWTTNCWWQNNPSWRNTLPQIINEILSYTLLIHQRIHNVAPDAKLLAFVYFSVISGPTERTVDDFWLMIWEQNPSGIVMVTKVFEMTKVTTTKISESETKE